MNLILGVVISHMQGLLFSQQKGALKQRRTLFIRVFNTLENAICVSR
jgi:hypothetical protein